MAERLTWKQICEKYPAQWVGMESVEFKEDGTNIISGIVKYTNVPRTELLRKIRRDKEDIVARHTDPDAVNHVGLLGGVKL